MEKLISTPSRTKKILQKYGLHAKKGYGQNFLVDPVIVSRCAEEGHCRDAVIEIGPGIGSLTEMLARTAKHVTAYEIDPDMIMVLKDTLSEYHNVEIIQEDFLKADLKGKTKELKDQYGEVSVCANLPYYITSPVLFRIFDNEDIRYITVMVQKEVGERFAALPNTGSYGAISVEAQYLYDVKKLFDVPGRSFNPSPVVDSVIIQFKRKPDHNADPQAFNELVRTAFKQRRKTIYNNLKDYPVNGNLLEILEEADIDPKKRAQELNTEDFERLLLNIYERQSVREN